MSAATSILRETVARNRLSWLAMTLGFTLLYHVSLVAGASLSTGYVPSYIRFYDWPADVLRIIASTPAISDMISVINDDWLMEVGAMNYQYGHGIAEWTFAIIPSHVAVALILSALVATSILLLRRSRETCPLAERGASATTAGVGALCVATANVTMSWIACCATPNWVVGLSLLGFESSSVFALLPYGGALTGVGFVLLAATTYWLAWRCAPRPPHEPIVIRHRFVVQDP